MLSLLKNIVDIIVTCVQFLINTITSLVTLFINIPKYTSFIISSLNLIPNVLFPFAVASISIYVVYLIVGRSHS